MKWQSPARARVYKDPSDRKDGPGAPIKYPVQNLIIGESLKIPFNIDIKKNMSMYTSIKSYGKRSGKKFGFDGVGGVCIITRLS